MCHLRGLPAEVLGFTEFCPSGLVSIDLSRASSTTARETCRKLELGMASRTPIYFLVVSGLRNQLTLRSAAER
jgi:hypothetical protein